MTQALKRILIQTRTNVFKHINISLKSFKLKYEYRQKFPKDRRKRVYYKKEEFYQRENVPLNKRRYINKDPKGWKESGEDYNRYIQSRREQKQRVSKRQRAEEEHEEEQQRRKEKQQKLYAERNQPVRVWMKVKYQGDEPIFIEAFMEGTQDDEPTMVKQLREFIMSNFNEEIGAMSEIGVEKIPKVKQRTPFLKYKHNLLAPWGKL